MTTGKSLANTITPPKGLDKHYLGVNASVEADEFTDIRLQSYIGPYYGRKLFNGSWGKLDGELGFVRGYRFHNAEDTEYYGANWNFTGEALLGGDSRFVLTHVGILNISDDNSLILDTTVGLGFLFFGLEAAAEFSIVDGAAQQKKMRWISHITCGWLWLIPRLLSLSVSISVDKATVKDSVLPLAAAARSV